MNCEDCLIMLDEYVENELDEKSAVRVSTHLEACEECAGEYGMLRLELQTYSQYLKPVEATGANWAKMRETIETAQRERFSLNNLGQRLVKTFSPPAFNPAFAALPLVLLITFAIILSFINFKSPENTFNEKTISQKTDIQSSPEKPKSETKNEPASVDKKRDISLRENKIAISQIKNRGKRNSAFPAFSKPLRQFARSKPISPNHKTTTVEIVGKAERQYLSAITILSRDIERRRAQLSPVILSQLEQSLAEVDNTITKTRQAVRQQPNDPTAVQYMTAAYAKKIELLRNAASN